MLAPASALNIHEKAWNAYPYCRTGNTHTHTHTHTHTRALEAKFLHMFSMFLLHFYYYVFLSVSPCLFLCHCICGHWIIHCLSWAGVELQHRKLRLYWHIPFTSFSQPYRRQTSHSLKSVIKILQNLTAVLKTNWSLQFSFWINVKSWYGKYLAVLNLNDLII